MSTDDQSTQCRRNIAENFNRLSRVHERYGRQPTDRQADGRAITYSERLGINQPSTVNTAVEPGAPSILYAGGKTDCTAGRSAVPPAKNIGELEAVLRSEVECRSRLSKAVVPR